MPASLLSAAVTHQLTRSHLTPSAGRPAPQYSALPAARPRARMIGSLRKSLSAVAGTFTRGRTSLAGENRRASEGMMPPAAAAAMPGAPEVELGDLEQLAKASDPTWTTQLNPDPETERHAPNKRQRQVQSGHFVLVRPDPLPRPELVIHSKAMAESLGIAEDVTATEQFKKFFSGDIDALPGFSSWATPYALAIMGQPMTSNCPFNNGNGYGDGRAISIGEVVVGGQRWELQLKGGGTTPFCRGGDGRAVLRSSVREFLASEAMFALGVDTTRALSLVASGTGGETVNRPWYKEIKFDDPRLAQIAPEYRAQVLGQPRNPDTMIEERCAITTRVAPSFLRVGHVDLFSRRARRAPQDAEAMRELELIVEHALFREYPEAGSPGDPLAVRALAMLDQFGERIAAMTAGWIRVGFCQGNFNSDNCLVGGRTMDYGPFGFMDKYDPGFAKWTGSGDHYAFINQPGASLANFATFAEAVAPVLGPGGEAEAEAAVERAGAAMKAAVDAVWAEKMGLTSKAQGLDLWADLGPLMESSSVEWTVFWRQLAACAEVPPSASDADLLAPLEAAFYGPLSPAKSSEWAAWAKRWRAAVDAEEGGGAAAAVRMRLCNPKYIPSEWRLVEAYAAANTGDYSVVHELNRAFTAPYDEHPELEEKWYRRAPDAALATGGTTFFS
eukprot:CAMPEP_0182914776 /NCGR_PEP_ID=MMETSP0034_2-20130328/38745_1 /TAXON_ID=156128 /ORGANISM="Nephroselmis pyriformis, Strain CCMP717" /LENGTH=671 /DNA_ID=CAMNT_0025051563 /DNA_START=60 /DNA_END=2075 /DNA_ORIENTATION=+